jgi:hypothetical protein
MRRCEGRVRRWGASVGSGQVSRGRRKAAEHHGSLLLGAKRGNEIIWPDRRTSTHRILHHRSLLPRHAHFHAVRHARGGRHVPRGRRIIQPRHGHGRGATRSDEWRPNRENGAHTSLRLRIENSRTARASEIFPASPQPIATPRWPWRRAPPCPSARRHAVAVPHLAPPSPPAARGCGERSLLDWETLRASSGAVSSDTTTR